MSEREETPPKKRRYWKNEPKSIEELLETARVRGRGTLIMSIAIDIESIVALTECAHDLERSRNWIIRQAIKKYLRAWRMAKGKVEASGDEIP